MSGRGSAPPPALRAAVLVLLAIAAVALWLRIYAFGQERFFTVDEYQYGHATWLLSQGQRPYVDFYEHHFPASYVLHAPLLAREGSFGERALSLRRITSGYLVAAAAVLALATRATTGNAAAALLSAALPFGFGFSLMSQVDYRADGFAACLLLACLALLEANRRWRRRGVAALAGLLAALAIGMTQKMLLLAGGSLVALWIADRIPALRRADGPRLDQPLWVALAAAAVLLAGGLAAAGLGLLPAGFESTIRHGFLHEELYPESSSSFGEFARPFLSHTAFTTLPLLAFAGLGLASREGRFWLLPVTVAVAGGALQRAQYPYNYVFLCLALGVAAVRGWARAVEALGSPLRPILYLAPLLVLPNQLGFTARASSNASQLALLDKIEAYSGPEDAVIDGAGGALFRPHGSYYFHHGDAHRLIFADYFERQLVDDYRRSRALFWIDDFRQRKLPAPVREYFESHYVWVDGSLYALGYQTPATGERAEEFEFELLRPGRYFVLPVRAERPAEAPRTAIDGVPVEGLVRLLRAGRHRIAVPPHAPGYAVTLLPPDAFRTHVAEGPHTRLFEYALPARASGQEGPGA